MVVGEGGVGDGFVDGMVGDAFEGGEVREGFESEAVGDELKEEVIEVVDVALKNDDVVVLVWVEEVDAPPIPFNSDRIKAAVKR